MKIAPAAAVRLIAATCLLTPLFSLAQDPAGSEIPEVRVTATSWKTAEPCPVCRFAPGILRFERSEAGKESLVIQIAADGTATPAKDYAELPSRVEIPVGESFVEIYLAPLDDEMIEGPEVVRVRILSGDGLYRVRPSSAEALIVIGDIEFGASDLPQARLDIVQPETDGHLRGDSIVKIEAIVVWTESEVLQPIAFYDGATLIGRSVGVPVFRAAVPCLPSVQTVYWTNPPTGDHLLSARVELSDGKILESPPVKVSVGEEPEVPTVAIETVSPIAEESSYPFRRLRFTGRLTISRTGSTEFSLPVFVHYSGTASPKDFNPFLPWLVAIPAGETSTEVVVNAYPDGMDEGIETLVATLSQCPPETDPPLGMPCSAFHIDPARASATVYLRDDGITRADITITRPEDGALFKVGTPIVIEAVAIDLEGYISRVEFFDGERLIGESEIVFVRAPDPGTPIHHSFEWTGAEVGGHVLTVRASISDELQVSSKPVRIRVDEIESKPPEVVLLAPKSGTEIPPLTPIELVAETFDSDGFVRKVAFLADGRQIGEVGLPMEYRPSPGETQRFVFLWRYPMPGAHLLSARAVDDSGAIGGSESVDIRVAMPETIPVVTIVARDPFAVEPFMDIEANPATFVVRRFGRLNQELAVPYSVRGSAENGVDFELLSGWVRFPVGQGSALVVARPLPDDELEDLETVIVKLEDSPDANTDPADPPYRIGYRGRAVALIRDQPGKLDDGRSAICIPIGDGFIHVRFAVEEGKHYRLEASGQMQTWETVYVATSLDGAIYYVDEEYADFTNRFYRVAEEPISAEQ